MTSVPPEALHERITQPGRGPVSMPASRPARPLTAFVLGVRLGRRQLVGRAAARMAVVAVALGITEALIERWAGKAGAVDRALDGTFHLLVPLLTLGIVSQVCGRTNLRDMTWRAARFGIARRDVALGLLASAALAAALLSALTAVAAVLAASSAATGPMGRDVFQSVWIAAVTASAYAGWFGLGSTFFARGGGRWVALLIDFVLGSSTGLAGVLLPRANATNLLGGAAPLGLGQPASAGVLVFLALFFGVLAAVRCRD